jgi:hypothetical protein
MVKHCSNSDKLTASKLKVTEWAWLHADVILRKMFSVDYGSKFGVERSG